MEKEAEKEADYCMSYFAIGNDSFKSLPIYF